MSEQEQQLRELAVYKYGFRDEDARYEFVVPKGLSKEVVEAISHYKGEPDWMRKIRLQALEIFFRKPMPTWGADLSELNFDEITYYAAPTKAKFRSWDEVPEYIKRTYERLGIPEAERKFLAGVGAQYDCLTADTVVFANPGAVPIAQIQPGQYVYSLDVENRKLIKQRVRAVVYKGELPVFEVKVAGRRIKATFNHPFLALIYRKEESKKRGRFEVAWRYLSDLQVGDYIAIVKKLPDEGQPYRLPTIDLTTEFEGRNQFGTFTVKSDKFFTRTQKGLRLPEQTTEAFMWLLGVYLGDGGLRRKGKKKPKTIVDIAFPASEPNCRQKLAEALREVFGYELRFDRDPYRVRIHSAPIARLFAALGLDATAKTKTVPPWVFGLPLSQKLAFIAGFIDADGHVRGTERNSDAMLTSANENLLRDIQRLAITCGLRVSDVYTFRSKTTYKGKTTERIAYRLLITGDLSPLAPYSVKVAANFKPRKYYQRYNSYHRSPLDAYTSDEIGFAPIESIRYLGVEPTYDIEVEGVHNFVAEGIVVHNSEVVYHRIREDLERLGVIFVDMDTAVREYPDLVREYFGTVIPPTDNKFAALNTAVWSGGSFIYVPKGVHVEMPLQAYFRINAENIGQFERTLIIAEEGSFVHYIEGCLPAGEKVSIGDRWVNIEAIKPGDFVVTATGERRRVRAVMTRYYKGDIVEVVPVSPHNAFRLTPEHPVLAVRRETVAVRRRQRNGWLAEVDTRKLLQAQPIYIPVGELKVGDFLVFPKFKADNSNTAFSHDQLRLLGYYLAEGSAFVHQKLKQPVVSFSFGEHETAAIEEVKELIRKVTGKRPQVVHQPSRHAVNITVYSRELMDFCLRHAGKGADSKQLSPEVMSLPPEQVKVLLDAYFAGDGNTCVKGNGNTWMKRISTASQTLAEQLQELLARMGIYASILKRKGGEDTIRGRRIRRKDQFTVVWTENKRWSEVRDAGDYFLVPVKRIRRIPYDGFVFNLHVEHPNAYLVRGFVAHNCTAPIYSTNSLHSAVVELIAKPGATIRYTTLQNWSHNVYNLVTKRGVAYEDAKIIWVDANIGCVCEGELVYTEHGPVPIEKVKPGTKVWSFDEASRQWVLRPVVARKYSGLQQVYEVVFANGRTVRLTANHPLLAVRYDPTRPKKLGRYSLQWVPLEGLSVGDYVVFPTVLSNDGQPYCFIRPDLPEKFVGRNQHGATYEIPSHSRLPVNLPEYSDEDLCWLLGLWIADGDYRIQNGNGTPRFGKVGWSVPESDRARRRLEELLKRYVGEHKFEQRSDGIYLCINSLEFALWLKANGFESGAKRKRIPHWVFNLPLTQRLAFLAGYLDGDGSASTSGLTVKSASRELLSDIQMLATTCGLKPSPIRSELSVQNINRTGQPKTYVSYRLTISQFEPLCPFLTDGLAEKLPTRKWHKRYHQARGIRPSRLFTEATGITRIVAIRPSVIAPTYDLEIEGTSNFVVNGILVHNSKVTMKYPCVYMVGKGARGEVLSVAFASNGQHQDAGAKMIHAAPYTTSIITSKSISVFGGRATYRGMVKVYPGCKGAKVNVRCDALLLDEISRTDTYPVMEIEEEEVEVAHEATVSKIGEEQLFYLQSRGLTDDQAIKMIVNGFFRDFAKELPMEYAVEFTRLIELQLEGSVG
jgi:Fe-S cluster assembly protein SufB